jgi:hypothetical protein
MSRQSLLKTSCLNFSNSTCPIQLIFIKIKDISYQIIEHLSHEVDQDGEIGPLSHKLLNEYIFFEFIKTWHNSVSQVIFES